MSSADEQNDGVVVMGVVLREGGITLDAYFPRDERKELMRTHSITVGVDQETYGQQVREIVEALEELAFDVHHGYSQQPKIAGD